MPEATDTLTIVECRKYITDANLTDKQIEDIRDALSSIIDNTLDKYLKTIKIKTNDNPNEPTIE